MAKKSKPRGFAAMDHEKAREISRMGGASVPAADRSFSLRPGFAAKAGSKGGSAVEPKNRMFSRDPALARAAGKKSAAVRKAKAARTS